MIRPDIKSKLNDTPVRFSGDLPEMLYGSMSQRESATAVRTIAINQFLEFLSEITENGERLDDAELLSMAEILIPNIYHVIECILLIKRTAWWMELAYASKGMLDQAPLFALLQELKNNRSNKAQMEQLASDFLTEACAVYMQPIEEFKSLIQYEKSLHQPLPELQGSVKQQVWGERLRAKAIYKRLFSDEFLLSIDEAADWIRANEFIEHGPKIA